MAAGELGDEPADVAAALQRQRRQVQARGPALGALAERRDDAVGQVRADLGAQQLARPRRR